MNITALKACFSSLSFRARIFAAMKKATIQGYQSYIKNRKGENFIRVDWDRNHGFTFRNRQGNIIDNKIIFSFLRQMA